METENTTHKAVKDRVIAKIRAGQVRMRPRIFFAVKIAALGVVTALVFILSIFLGSFVYFDLSATHRLVLLDWGKPGLLAFIEVFPWLAVFLDIAFVIVFGWLVHRLKMGYRRPVVYLSLAVIIIVFGTSSLLCETPIQRTLLARQQNGGGVPVIGSFYEDILHSSPEKGVFRGTVVAVDNGTFDIEHNEGDTDWDHGHCTVVPPLGANLLDAIRPGDRVIVGGTYNEEPDHETIYAYGFQKI